MPATGRGAARRSNLTRLIAAITVATPLGFTPAPSIAGAEPPRPPVRAPVAAAARPAFETAPPAERQSIQRLAKAAAWPRRAIAALRLERFGDDASRDQLVALFGDAAWQVRAFAVASLGRRRAELPEGLLGREEDPRVLRTALRHRYTIDRERLERGVRYLAKQNRLESKMLAVELAAVSGDPELIALGRETARTVILRMSRTDAGALSPRLAAVTGGHDHRRHYRWQQWLTKTGRGMRLSPAFALPEGGGPAPLSGISRLDAERFADLEDYIASLHTRRVDLVICLDTTASMWGELAQAQAGLDDMMLFAGDVVAQLRVGIMAYRDKRDRYETKGWDLTDDINIARQRLWQLTADGGGDTPEAVYPAMRRALHEMSWGASHEKVLIVVGDAPPHVGFGTKCVELAERAHAQAELTTHAIQTGTDPVPHFAEIAKSGGGRCTTLEDDASLVSQITGLTLGRRFGEELEEFFNLYLRWCR